MTNREDAAKRVQEDLDEAILRALFDHGLAGLARRLRVRECETREEMSEAVRDEMGEYALRALNHVETVLTFQIQRGTYRYNSRSDIKRLKNSAIELAKRARERFEADAHDKGVAFLDDKPLR